MNARPIEERHNTVIIGAGQAGLSVGYHLQRRGVPFVILEANQRIGDSWRQRWDSLRLFTPARYDGLDGMRFPGPDFAFPTRDEMADYLEAYAARFDLPVRTGMRVERVTRRGDRFLVQAGDTTLEADNVVVAMATFERPNVPAFARELAAGIVQLHSSEYRNAAQLQDGPVLIVGAGNSGAEIAVEVVRGHRVLLAGRDVGGVPFDIAGAASRLFLARFMFRVVFHRIAGNKDNGADSGAVGRAHGRIHAGNRARVRRSANVCPLYRRWSGQRDKRRLSHSARVPRKTTRRSSTRLSTTGATRCAPLCLCQVIWSFACSTSAPNAAASRTARSASTFRFTSMPARFRPFMKRE